MRAILLSVVVLLASAAAAAAQSPIVVGPNSVLAWEVTVPDVATARALTIAVSVDGAAAIPPSPINCGPGPTGSSGVFTCSSLLSQIPTGSHSLTATAALGGVTSLPSTPFAYVDFLIPIPQNLRGK